MRKDLLSSQCQAHLKHIFADRFAQGSNSEQANTTVPLVFYLRDGALAYQAQITYKNPEKQRQVGLESWQQLQ